MEETPKGTDEKHQGQDDAARSQPRPSQVPKEGNESDVNYAEEYQQEPEAEQPPPHNPSWLRSLFGLFNKSDWVMVGLTAVIVLLTAVIAGTGVVGIILVIQGGQDTIRIRDAAEKQACAAQRNADAAQQFADTAGDIKSGIDNAVTKLDAQAKATQAATRASIAALHVSERAYIIFGEPQADFPNKVVYLQFLNTGHIPSGPVEIVAHEATLNIDAPANIVPFGLANEKSWARTKYQQISPSVPAKLGVPVPLASVDRIKIGTQIIVVAGYATYYDGFANTPQQRQSFCIQTIYHAVAKEDFIVMCDPAYVLPQMEAADGYPNNESAHYSTEQR